MRTEPFLSADLSDGGSTGRSRQKSSKYRGVSKCSKDGRWQARIRVGKVVKYLGRFSTQEEAAAAYDKGALQYHGQRAITNFNRDEYGTIETLDTSAVEAEVVKAAQLRKKRRKRNPSAEGDLHLPQLLPSPMQLSAEELALQYNPTTTNDLNPFLQFPAFNTPVNQLWSLNNNFTMDMLSNLQLATPMIIPGSPTVGLDLSTAQKKQELDAEALRGLLSLSSGGMASQN